MKYHLVQLCLAIVFSLFFIKAACSVNVSAKYDNVNPGTEVGTVFIVKNVLELRCNVSEEVTMKWLKGGKELNSSEAKRFIFKELPTNVYTLRTDKATEDDVGNYSCVAYTKDQKQGSANFTVAHEVHVKVPTNINVVEGEKLKIECLTIGRPKVKWTYRPEGAGIENTTVLGASERITFSTGEANVNGSVVEITGITEKDRGNYTCEGWPTHSPEAIVVKSSCIVRVKGRYAALWPFLGICVEVFVLCLIIFIYEKKRNKTELEESDTDQSPDQKNTPDHGKDSNLRHRQ